MIDLRRMSGRGRGLEDGSISDMFFRDPHTYKCRGY